MKRADLIEVIDLNKKVIAVKSKLEVHENGLFHKAFSVIIVNDNNEMLLQKRAATKYHFAGKWSNACCGHPYPKENILEAANRRVYEEIGIRLEIKELFSLSYSCFDNESGMHENEFDTVFIGKYNKSVTDFNKNEISKIIWVHKHLLQKEYKINTLNFTPWFVLILEKYFLLKINR